MPDYSAAYQQCLTSVDNRAGGTITWFADPFPYTTINPWPNWIGGINSINSTTVWGNWLEGSGSNLISIQPAWPTQQQQLGGNLGHPVGQPVPVPQQPRIEVGHERARELLLSLLDPDQAQEFERNSRFNLRSGTRLYRIGGPLVEQIDPMSRVVIARFCIHPADCLPHHDYLIAQKLLLEADEPLFLATAHAA